MRHSDFVPLHLHTQYSLLDGAIKIDELVETAAGFGMPAVAITDHGNMFGAVEFYTKALKAGVKPIIGCEVYLCQGDMREKDEERPFHLILLASDETGYRNLVELVSASFINGFYKRPRIDRAMLESHNTGLIGLSACLQGEVPWHMGRGDVESARKAALWYSDVLGKDNFFLELQKNGLPEQEAVNRKLVALGRELGMGLVATNDCHYLRESDVEAHEVLLCIQTGSTMSDPDRFRFRGHGYYFRSPDQMKEDFREVPDAVTRTREIAERCNVSFKTDPLLPMVKMPDGKPPSDAIRLKAEAGLRAKFGGEAPEHYRDRLRHEIEVITRMGYSSYFLIVEDFIGYAKSHGIPVGPGRGSAAGSLVAYVLGITELDPIRYGLLFERFLNPERVSMPDIDVDFCKDKRGEVIRHVTEKYGKDHVAQIITFGTMAARAAIRDVARAMDFPYADADKLAKLVPETLKIKLKDAIDQEPELKRLYDESDNVKKLLDIAMRLEGLTRHASTHAAGVVIAPEPLTHYAPLYKAPNDEAITTQFDMGSVEKIGLIKFDFLGLKTLTVIQKCVDYLRAEGREFSIEKIPLDDRRTYEFLGTGQTTGVFQLESDGMRDILIRMQPSEFEDIIALVALYRPGPIGSGMVDDFIRRKRDGKKAIEYELPQLKEVLDETYGVILYQEQVMAIANRLGGFSLGQADVLRKAMGKKIPEVMAQQKEIFVTGAENKKIDTKKAAKLFDLMAKFAEYGFNKSHSAAYALIAYQTAYLKAHFPVHFMAATMSLDLDSSDKIVKSIKECRAMGIRILPPDVNRCGLEFTVDGDAIRFGLGAVKGAGAAAIEAVISARAGRHFDSIEDYLTRVDSRKVNKRVNESFIKAGAFDALFDSDGTMQSLCKARAKAMSMLGDAGGQAPSLSLFGDDSGGPDAEGWSESELLKSEKEALGFYITGNPMSRFSRMLEAMNIRNLSALLDAEDGTVVETAGIVMAIRKLRTKKGDQMAALGIEDEDGSAEVIVFPELYKTQAGLIDKDKAMVVRGALEKSEKGLKIVAEEMSAVEDLPYRQGGSSRRAVISLKGGESGLRPDSLHALKELVERHRGDLPLYLRIRGEGADTLLQTSHAVVPDLAFIEEVEGMCGKGTIKVV